MEKLYLIGLAFFGLLYAYPIINFLKRACDGRQREQFILFWMVVIASLTAFAIFFFKGNE